MSSRLLTDLFIVGALLLLWHRYNDNIRHGNDHADRIYASQILFWRRPQQSPPEYMFLHGGTDRCPNDQGHWKWLVVYVIRFVDACERGQYLGDEALGTQVEDLYGEGFRVEGLEKYF